MVAVLRRLIGPNVQLHHSKMLVKPPERGAPFPMHQDYPFFPHAEHPTLAASVHLDDADEENGCLYVAPGSHRLGPLATADGGTAHHLDPDAEHVNWGQGLMVCGHNPAFRSTRPRFRLEEQPAPA